MPLPPVNTQGTLSLQTPLPIQVAAFARNGLVPHAVFESDVAASLNFTAATRTKNLFTWSTPIASIPSGAGSTRTRWRAAAHTGPLLRRLKAIVLLAQSNVTFGGGGGSNPAVTLYVTNANESTTYGSGTFSFGAIETSPTDYPSAFGWGEIIIGGVPADTDVYLRFDDVNGGRLISATVYEESLKLLSGNGYVLPSNVAATSPIYDARRETEYELATSLWNRGAAHLWNWTVDNGASPQTIASSTPKNIVDNSSTSVSASTPGATLDLRYHRTLANTTVPVKLAVFGSYTGGGGFTSGGNIYVKDSGGSTVGSITAGWSSTTPAWVTATFNMSASEAKYDIWYSNGGGGTFSLHAVSLLQYA